MGGVLHAVEHAQTDAAADERAADGKGKTGVYEGDFIRSAALQAVREAVYLISPSFRSAR